MAKYFPCGDLNLNNNSYSSLGRSLIQYDRKYRENKNSSK